MLASTRPGFRILAGKASLQAGHVALQAAYAPKHNARRASAPSLGELHASAAYKSGAATSRRGSNPVLAAHGYEELSPIASGAFSMVVRALRTETAQEVAIKTFQRVKIEAKDKAAAANMRNELPSSSGCSRRPPGDRQRDRGARGGRRRVALDTAGGSLRRQLQVVVRGLAERVAATVIGQVASALRHLHAAGACHRDVKPENVLYVDGACTRVKLCDFGFAVICSSDRRLKTVCGASVHGARDLARRSRRRGPPVDMWSLGALAYEALRPPPSAAVDGAAPVACCAPTTAPREELGGRAPSSPHSSCPTPPRAPPPPPPSTTRSSRPTLASTCRLPALRVVAAVVVPLRSSAERPRPPPPASPPPAIDVSVSRQSRRRAARRHGGCGRGRRRRRPPYSI